ncbi:hypothetical protein BKI52_02095 [marine bacterium AO1-C]|nr:hypothetical protein BKI52_02095 [marine bacterium AO1-C]
MTTLETQKLEVLATPILFLPKRKKLKKQLVDFREKHRIFEVLANRYVIGIIAVSGVPFQPMVDSIWPAFITLMVISPLLQWFVMIDMPSYFEVDDENILFHNFEATDPEVIKSANLTKMAVSKKSIATAPLHQIKKMEIVYSIAFSCYRLRVKTNDWTCDFDYKLSYKTHQKFAQYMRSLDITFDTQKF